MGNPQELRFMALCCIFFGFHILHQKQSMNVKNKLYRTRHRKVGSNVKDNDLAWSAETSVGSYQFIIKVVKWY